MLNKVIVAFLVELMRLVAGKLHDLVLVHHLLVAKDALAALRLRQPLVDRLTETTSLLHTLGNQEKILVLCRRFTGVIMSLPN